MGLQGDAVRRNFYDKHSMRGSSTMPNQSNNKFMDLYNMYNNTLSELCMNRFKWTGLPSSVDVRFLEQTLFNTGLSVFYFDERYDQYLALRGTSAGSWNFYDNPTAFQVNGNSFINRVMPASECVPIWANYTRTPDLDIVRIYATKLADLDMTIELNAHNARRTRAVATTDNQRLSAANFMQQVDRGDPVIMFRKGSMDAEDFTTVDWGVHPDQLINIHMFRTRLWSECMGLLGIDNANQDKKERLVASEVSANDGQTDNMRRVSLNAREEAAKAINAKWPNLPPITVGFHVDDTPSDDDPREQTLSSTTERSLR